MGPQRSPFSLKPNVNFLNRRSEVTSVLPNNGSTETIDAIAENEHVLLALANPPVSGLLPPTSQVSESEADLFGEDSNSKYKILPHPSKKSKLVSI